MTINLQHERPIRGVRQDEPRGLVRYLAEFGLSMSELAPAQVAMFLAARNAEGCLEDVAIPVGSRNAESDAAVVERDADRLLELTARDRESYESRLPSDDMDVQLIQSVEELARIFPTQWLLEDLQPTLFYAKLAQRELLVPRWQLPASGQHDSHEDTPDREVIDERTAARSDKPHAYVLLDTSRTMNDHDRRGTVARGLALAFLLKAHRQRVRLNLRPFTDSVGDLSTGTSEAEFREIVRRIIHLPNAGQTRIQTALEQAVADIRKAGPLQGAAILLITDGLAKLSDNPLRREKLHTFIVGDVFEEESTRGTLNTLQEWSSTFHRVWQNRFAPILAPTLEDCRAALRELEKVAESSEQDSATSPAGALGRAVKNAKFLLKELKRSLGKQAAIPDAIRSLDERLARAERKTAETAARTRDAAARSRVRSLCISAASGGSSVDLAGFWELLRSLAVCAWQWIGGGSRKTRSINFNASSEMPGRFHDSASNLTPSSQPATT